jgi:hypothetical protein
MLGFPSADEHLHAPDLPPIAPMDGPEKPEILDRVEGWVLEWESGQPNVTLHEIPSLVQRTITTASPVDTLSGPDADGRFIYEAHGNLRLASVDGQDEKELFHRAGGDSPAVQWFAIAPQKELMAVALSRTSEFTLGDPIDIQIWNVATGEHRSLGRIDAVMNGCWFQDAKRLMVEVVSIRPADVDIDPETGLRHTRHPEEDTRDLEILDIETGSLTPVCAGTEHLLSPDDRRLIYSPAGSKRMVRELSSGLEETVKIPGSVGDVYAWISADIVLYAARPTAGENPGVLRTGNKYPQAKWTAKAARLNTWDFVTVSPSVGRFQQFSVGLKSGRR